MSKSELKKDIGFIPALSVVIGMVVGSGVFFKPTAVFSATGAPGLGLAAWILGGLITIAAGLTVAEIGAAIPKTGGAATYLKEIYGDLWGFLFGWAQLTIYFPGTMAALGIIFATQTVNLLGLSKALIIPIAIGLIIFLAVLNMVGGSKAGAAIQTVATAGKLVPLVLIIVAGFMKSGSGSANLLPMTVADHPVSTGFGSALIACLFAYNGWLNVSSIGGEMKNPGKDMPKAIAGGLSIVMAVYVLINVAYLMVLPATKLASTATPAADVAVLLFGPNGGKIITCGILLSIFGTLNGYLFTGPRVPYALAIEDKLPASKWFAKLHKKSGLPVNACIFMVFMASAYIFTGTYDKLTNLIVFVMWMFYILTFVGVFVLRKKQPNLHRPYKVPLYPVIPVLAIIAGVYLIVNTVITQPGNAAVGIGLTLVGVPIFMYKRSKRKPQGKENLAESA